LFSLIAEGVNNYNATQTEIYPIIPGGVVDKNISNSSNNMKILGGMLEKKIILQKKQKYGRT